MSLKTILYKEIFSKILDPIYEEGKWRILVMDDISTKIVSSILKMEDICDRGITLVDNLFKKREPVPMEAIYLLTPKLENIQNLINDFATTRTYHYVHVYFTDECPEDGMQLLSQSIAANYILTLKEVYINFLVNEGQLFTVELEQNLVEESQYHNDGYTQPSGNPFDQRVVYNESNTDELYQKWARSLAAVCSNLNENPSVICQNTERVHRFSHCFKEEISKKAVDNQSLGQALHRDKSIILILDRSFDPLTPLLHDLHLQCLAYDLLDIDKNVYSYKNQDTEKQCQVNLSDEESMWCQLRHMHIADVSRLLPLKLKQLATAQQNIEGGPISARSCDGKEQSMSTADVPDNVTKQLKFMMKKLPHIRQEVSSVSHMFHLSEACLRLYQAGVDKLCECEQNLVMGQDVSGDVVKNQDKLVGNLFNNFMTTMSEKIRLLLTLVLTENNISDESILELIEKFNIDDRIYSILSGLCKLGHFLKQTEIPKIIASKCYYLANYRRNLFDISSYTVSRWIPFIKDLIEDCINGRIHPSLVRQRGHARATSTGLRPQSMGLSVSPSSVKRLSWASTDDSTNNDPHRGPRLIVFVLGGISFSESRIAYNITKLCQEMKNGGHIMANNKPQHTIPNGGGRGWSWEVIVGSTCVITPENYLNLLSNSS